MKQEERDTWESLSMEADSKIYVEIAYQLNRIANILKKLEVNKNERK